MSENTLIFIHSHQLLLCGLILGYSFLMGCWFVGRKLRSILWAMRHEARVFNQRASEETPAPSATPVRGENDFEKYIVMVSQISDMARKQPAHVAAVFKSWLHDEQRLRTCGLCLKALGIEVAKLVATQLHSKDMAKLGVILSDRGVTHPSDRDTRVALDELHAALIAYEFMQGNGDWGFLGRLSDDGLTTVMRTEDLAGTALILFHLPASRAARIYGVLDERTKHNVVEALFKLETQSAKATVEIALRVKRKADQILGMPQGAVSGTASWVAIVGGQLLEKDRRVLLDGAHGATDAFTLAELKVKLFSFTDAGILPLELLSSILQSFTPNEIAGLVASLPESSALLGKIDQALPPRIREIVSDEAPLIRQALARPHTRHRAIHEMRVLRTRFEDVVKDMHARGEISLTDLVNESLAAA